MTTAFDLSKSYADFTLGVDDAIATQCCGSTMVDFSMRTPDQFQSTSVLTFSPHAVTHLNIFPPDSRYHGPYFLDPEIQPVWEERTAQFGTRCVWPSIVLDVSAPKQERMEEMLGGVDKGDGDYEYLSEAVGPDRIAGLTKDLAISPSDILEACPDLADLGQRFVVLHTGWRRFAPRSKDLAHPSWVALHPFLLSPYLLPDSLKLLRTCNVLGIGADVFSLERPRTNLDHSEGTDNGLDDTLQHEQGHNDCIYADILDLDGDWLPLVECLAIPDSLLYVPKFGSSLANIVASKKRTAVLGALAMFLFDDSITHSAIPARVLFQECTE